MGTEFGVATVMVTESGALSSKPSFTVSVDEYVPTRSAVKLGPTNVESSSSAALPSGTDVKLHK